MRQSRRWVRRMVVIIMSTALASVGAGSLGAQEEEAGSQVGSVTGVVVDEETQEPVAGASVYVVGTQRGALTDGQGQFTIAEVPAGARTVRAQVLGYGTRDARVDVVAGGLVEADLGIRRQALAVDPVVVTALGIQNAERSLGYTVQSIDRTRLDRTSELNFVDALAGQMAGVHVTESSGQPGTSARITIRGEASFRGDGQPLFIVDGVPITNELDPNSPPAHATVQEGYGYHPLDRGQAGSRVMDIDPANIEELSVLRGAAAAALYGSQASLGAVVIRTRRGNPGEPLRFTVSSRFGFEEAILEGLQTSWAAGQDGLYCDIQGTCEAGAPAQDPAAPLTWGPHRSELPSSAGNVSFQDPRQDFLRTGQVSTNSLYGTGSLMGGTYGLGFSYTQHTGVMTRSGLDRMNFNANLSFNLTPTLSARTTVLHGNTMHDWGWEGAEGLVGMVSQLPPTRDLADAWEPDGTPVMYDDDLPHPQWLAENEYAESATSRWIASQTFTWEFAPGFELSNRTGLDNYVDQRRENQNERPWLTARDESSGGTRQQKLTRRAFSNDLVLSVSRRTLDEEGRWGITGLIGGNLLASTATDISAWGLNMSVPGFYQLGNFTTRWANHTLPAERRLLGAYGQWTVDYENWGFATLTGRNDWSSTLPLDDNSYFYPSLSLAAVFTDALEMDDGLLDYGKVRLSLARVGADAPPYQLRGRYRVADWDDYSSGTGTPTELRFRFRGAKGMFEETQMGNPNIKPESTVEAEAGVTLHWLEGMARTDLAVYNRRSYDQIFDVPVPPATGYYTVAENAGDLTNRGFELTVGVTPVRSQNMSLDLTANVARNWSNVEELTPEVDHITLAGPGTPGAPEVRIAAGHSYGLIWGTGHQRNEQGELLIGADGWPLVQEMALGTMQPEWLANFHGILDYGSFSLSGLLDLQRGGEVLNGDLMYTIPAGTAGITEDRHDSFVWPGVSASSGQENTVQLQRDQEFWTRYATVHENLVESADVVRLREATLAYRLPPGLSSHLQAVGASLYVTGRNLFVSTPFSYGDPAGTNYGSTNAGGAGYRLFTVPTTRTVSVGLRATF